MYTSLTNLRSLLSRPQEKVRSKFLDGGMTLQALKNAIALRLHEDLAWIARPKFKALLPVSTWEIQARGATSIALQLPYGILNHDSTWSIRLQTVLDCSEHLSIMARVDFPYELIIHSFDKHMI